MNEHLERNKRNAQAFYDLMFNQCRPAEAVEQEWPGDSPWAGIDIFRFDTNGKIVEH